jgi:hypothetical protein
MQPNSTLHRTRAQALGSFQRDLARARERGR